MSNPWFRFYSEWLDDEKVQMMPLDMQRHLVALFCLRCQRPTEKMTSEQIAFRLRVDETFLKRIHETFLKQGFIERDWSIANWNKRQYASDSSTARVQKHREKIGLKQSETLHVTNETVTVTAPEQNRTDTEQIQTKTTASQATPIRGRRIPPDFSVTEEHRLFAEKNRLVSPDSEIGAFKDYWEAKAGRDAVKLDWDKTFRNWLRNAQTFKRNGGSNGGSNGHSQAESKYQRAEREALEILAREEADATQRGAASKRLWGDA
jgi:hypothetical protein